MTTTKLKRKVNTMTEQTPAQGLSMSEETVTLVKSTVEGVNVISMQDLMRDFKNRMTINNHELRELGKDLRWVVNTTQPHVEVAVDTIKGSYNRASSFVAKSYGTKA